MKFIKFAIGALVGIFFGTVACWGSLYLYGEFVLQGEGSLFDTNPQAANTFFIVWIIVCLLFALLGIRVTSRKEMMR